METTVVQEMDQILLIPFFGVPGVEVPVPLVVLHLDPGEMVSQLV
jgi:hypothetical protein